MRFFLSIFLLVFASLPGAGSAAEIKDFHVQIQSHGSASTEGRAYSTALNTSALIAEAIEMEELRTDNDGECTSFARWIPEVSSIHIGSRNLSWAPPPAALGLASLSPRAPPSLL